MKTTTKLWIGIGALAIATPIGLYLPARFRAGDAWGEWDVDKVKEMVGYVPSGLEKLGSLWNAAMPDYAFRGWEDKGPGHLSVAYVFSAVLGVALCAGGAWILGKLLTKKKRA